MHAHDRTHLASLGFADKDKSDRRHDQACQFLATPSIQAKVAGLFRDCRPVASHDENPHHSKLTFESVITKGDGKFSTTVGFVDLVIPLWSVVREEVQAPAPGPDAEFDWATGEWVTPPGRILREYAITVAVEVKVHPVQVGDVIRQIKTYRQYRHHNSWLLATLFDITRADALVLRNEGIRHIRLGSLFDEWVASQKASVFASDSEVF